MYKAILQPYRICICAVKGFDLLVYSTYTDGIYPVYSHTYLGMWD